jgi:proteasome lid subunit RPN8/RPN11
MDKVSDKYPKIEMAAIGELAGDILSIASVFDNGCFSLIELDNETIGLCGGINTFARSKSALQRIEPVVIAIPKTNWQTNVPFSFSDDPKFPFDKFAHVNYQHGDYPPTFCLSRENIDDWYAEHTLKEYVELVAQWLRDAAKGKLMKITENDEFEPQRIHDINCLLYRVSFMDYYLEHEDTQCCYYSIFFDEFKPKIAYGNEENNTLNDKGIGVRLFAGKDHIDDTWYISYPRNLRDLYVFIQARHYPLNLDELKSKLDENKQAVYFQIALLRPVKLIQKNTRINYLCFRAQATDILQDNLDAKVDEVTIIDMTDCKSAQYLSKTPDSIFTKNITLLGCGAVGSKIACHLHRSGIYSINLVDKDTFQPHNVCRHALTEFKPLTFNNKAKAMKKAMSGMFYGMSSGSIIAYDEDALKHLTPERLDKIDIIIDATASVHVMYGLDAITFPDKTRIVRVALSEGGDVGVTYLGIDSKQPLADYYMEILRASLSNDQVYSWLSSERKNSTENIRVGEGCHSNTMRISDDTISAHAALMSSAIRHIYESKQYNRIILSFAHRDFPGSMQTCTLPVKPFHQFPCENDIAWTVRIPQDLLDEIRIKAKIAGQKENGGYLFGHIDYKRRVIYPLVHYMPRDSKGNKSGFRLGTSGLKDFKNEINQRSIGQIEYIGDWHSHPACSLDMSAIDVTTCYADVLPQLKNGIGLCVITKTNDTKFFLIEPHSNDK